MISMPDLQLLFPKHSLLKLSRPASNEIFHWNLNENQSAICPLLLYFSWHILSPSIVFHMCSLPQKISEVFSVKRIGHFIRHLSLGYFHQIPESVSNSVCRLCFPIPTCAMLCFAIQWNQKIVHRITNVDFDEIDQQRQFSCS